MSDFDTYHDQVIVFEAVKASDVSRLVPREPLQPKANQTFSPTPQNHTQGMDGTDDIKSSSNLAAQPLNGFTIQDKSQENSAHRIRNTLSRLPTMGYGPPSNRPMSPGQDSVSLHSSHLSRLSKTPSTLDQNPRSAGVTGFDRFYESLIDRFRVSYAGHSGRKRQS